jgi:membrane protein implicated in regulation of membrane protease activity
MLLLSIYAAALVFGGIFVAASALGFDKAHEAEVHAEPELGPAEVGADAAHAGQVGHGEAGPAVAEAGALVATFLSLRFWTFAITSFGLSGTLMHVLGVSPVISLPSSLLAGFGIGLAVATLFRLANKRQVGTIADVKSLLGREGAVLLAIAQDKPGKIRVTHDGQSLDLVARTRDNRRFERGERVLVVDMSAGEATITSPTPAHARA